LVLDQKSKKIYTVSQITHRIYETLDSNFSFIWVTGEISNFKAPSSGHYYFSLKDNKALINAAIFKNQQRNLKFVPENGLEVTGFGRISVYPPRGSYQIIFEYLEPKGLGSLQLLFEQTKEKLRQEGLFEEKYKKKLPFLPSKISLVTSPTGAAVRDMLKVFKKRFNNIEIEIYPVSVQGENAHKEIINALNDLNEKNDTDLIIIARGGGSFEDLMAFNSEDLARTVFNSQIPVVSGVGHETDFTIIDFVSDLRAPTPTAAAEYSVPAKTDLINTLNIYKKRLGFSLSKIVEYKKQNLRNTEKRLKDPQKNIEDTRLYIDENLSLLEKRVNNFISLKKDYIKTLEKGLTYKKLNSFYETNKNRFEYSYNSLIKNYGNFLEKKRFELDKNFYKLFELGPKNILKRGYSITRDYNTKKILRSVQTDVKQNDRVEVVMHDGTLLCTVNEIIRDEN
jgi:exodeoxyribonuclease VII large subunit